MNVAISHNAGWWLTNAVWNCFKNVSNVVVFANRATIVWGDGTVDGHFTLCHNLKCSVSFNNTVRKDESNTNEVCFWTCSNNLATLLFASARVQQRVLCRFAISQMVVVVI